MALKYASVDLEYKKNKLLRKEDVQHLQDWLKKQSHMPEIVELEIIFFLKSCKYRVELTKLTIDNCYTLKGLSKEILGRRDLKSWEATLCNVLMLPLPKLTSDGYQIFYNKVMNPDPNQYIFVDTVKCSDVILRMTLLQKGTVSGLIYIFDMEGFSLSHIARIPLSALRKLMFYFQEGLPLQLSQFHVINADARLDKLMAIVKPFLKKKLFHLIHVHSDYEKTLYDHFSQEYMPKEFGGLGKSIQELQEEVRTLVLNGMDCIEEDERRVIDETKRVQKSTRFDHLFGMEGTFKQMELD